MKIAILTEIINSHSGSRAPLEIARHLALLGNNVTIYAYTDMLDKSALKSLKKDGAKITLIKKPKVKFFAKQIAILKLHKILKQDSPDIATFSGTPPFFIAAKLAQVPVVRIYQGVQFDAYLEKKLPNEKPNLFEKIINSLANIIIFLIDFSSFRLSNAVVTISRFSAKEGKRLYKRKADAVIYHGTTIFKKPKKTSKKDPAEVNIVSVSRITPYKGFHKIIEAINNVKTKKKVTLTICGSQPKKRYLNYLKNIAGNKLKIVINPSDKELAEIYSKSDIYAAADRYLYFGLPITEAAAYNIPAVSLNLAAAKEVISHNQSGYIANNQKEFTLYLQRLINNPKLRFQMGTEANKRAQTFFSWKKIAQEYHKLLENVLRRPAKLRI